MRSAWGRESSDVGTSRLNSFALDESAVERHGSETVSIEAKVFTWLRTCRFKVSAMHTIGFIGLGVMGAPMCRNMTNKHAGKVVAHDLSPSAREKLAGTGAEFATSIAELMTVADIIFLSLPGHAQVEAVCLGPQGIAAQARRPAMVVDLSTTSVSCAREVALHLGEAGTAFVDAPVARTREAAERGELSLMVGATDADFALVEPLLRYIGTDITHCGPVGSGQFVKLVNNALLDASIIALAEYIVLAERTGVDPAVMVGAVSKGSGDSYALRHHAVKSMLPRDFPAQSFSSDYKIKDLSYLQELARETGTPARSLELALEYFRRTSAAGYADRYFTSVIEVVAAEPAG